MSVGGLASSSVTAVVVAAFVAALAGHLGARVAARAGPVHVPNDARFIHKKATPSGGGLGVVAGMCAALMVASLLRPQGVDAEGALRLAATASLALVVAGIGLFDDLGEWPAQLKFPLLAATSLALAIAAGAPLGLPLAGALDVPLGLWLGLLGSALWVFTVKNAVNFMDGANGLAGGAVGLASAGLAVLATLTGATEAAIAAAALAGALFGFLPVNAPVARVFMGDVGSLFIGAWFAAAGLLFVIESPRGAVYLPPLLLLPILADALLTMAWHVKHRIPLMKPHLDHAYQLRIRRGESHAEVVRETWARCAALASVAVIAFVAVESTGEPVWALGGLALGAAASTWWWLRDRALRSQAA
jgi:UDP-N-acetylmuramyl pentapeptide phosphotransferase/UDP-N-acetylglucosamine-1-phosphate transferase